MQLAVGRPSPASRRFDVMAVHVAIEMEPKGFGTRSPHRDDRGEVALFTSTHHGHRRPVTR
jgi:hypothetical protein